MNKLFVYGIFLGDRMRSIYGMSLPKYATVRDYATWGNKIVAAHKQEGAGLALTGLVVHVNPKRWADIDALEAGYNRILITTTDGEQAYMYAGKELDDKKQRGSDT